MTLKKIYYPSDLYTLFPEVTDHEAAVRSFTSGATRSSDAGKLDYEGFLSPLVLERFAQYMNANRVQPDGTIRASDNWQKGLPRHQTLKSLLRHVMDVWLIMRGARAGNLESALCAVIFNAQAILHEILIGRDVQS